MVADAITRRRRLGAVLLVAALALLVAGQTVLKNRLHGLGFLLYWLACFLLTGAAILVAYLDALALRQRTRREARELLQSTLDEIETDARKKPRTGGRTN
jgi:hypothetical protein